MAIPEGDPRRLDVREINDISRSLTGLEDMGEPDILPGMEILRDSIVREAAFDPNGIEAMRGNFISWLNTRRRVEDIFRRHPEIAHEPIARPIIIVGIPRSGTTKMQSLMLTNPNLQGLYLWRVLNPTPIGPTPPGGEDPRIAIAEQVSAAMRQYQPDFYAGHPMNAREPEEEIWMADLVMRGWSTCYVSRTPTFQAWLKKQDYGVWYDYLKKLLQMFQWEDKAQGKRWLLKAPEHCPNLADLFRVFPDATIIHCHRDPVTTIASLGALTAKSRRLYSSAGTLEEGGRFAFEHWVDHTNAYMRDRPKFEKEHPFLDISYRDITANAVATVEQVYKAAGLEFTPRVRDAVLKWEADNPPGKHGKHSYTLESLGLETGKVRAAFAGYLERFSGLT